MASSAASPAQLAASLPGDGRHAAAPKGSTLLAAVFAAVVCVACSKADALKGSRTHAAEKEARESAQRAHAAAAEAAAARAAEAEARAEAQMARDEAAAARAAAEEARAGQRAAEAEVAELLLAKARPPHCRDTPHTRAAAPLTREPSLATDACSPAALHFYFYAHRRAPRAATPRRRMRAASRRSQRTRWPLCARCAHTSHSLRRRHPPNNDRIADQRTHTRVLRAPLDGARGVGGLSFGAAGRAAARCVRGGGVARACRHRGSARGARVCDDQRRSASRQGACSLLLVCS
jgi:hypothetical protein